MNDLKQVFDLHLANIEDIKHINYTGKILSITHCPEATHYNRCVVVWKSGLSESFSVNGVKHPDSRHRFNYRKKEVKYIKPLHQVLSEAENYRISHNGSINAENWNNCIITEMMSSFGGKYEDRRNTCTYDSCWTEIKEVNV
jgi:hypothetical protein